ncbi:hypothetical protein LY76DRAFT_263728 [Colletotrichum caudatum]|nr:hypothetical protein LY76DRAFT_263728 [Colletotrichum caudatum]
MPLGARRSTGSRGVACGFEIAPTNIVSLGSCHPRPLSLWCIAPARKRLRRVSQNPFSSSSIASETLFFFSFFSFLSLSHTFFALPLRRRLYGGRKGSGCPYQTTVISHRSWNGDEIESMLAVPLWLCFSPPSCVDATECRTPFPRPLNP